MEDKSKCPNCGADLIYIALARGSYRYKVKKDGFPYKNAFEENVYPSEGHTDCTECEYSKLD